MAIDRIVDQPGKHFTRILLIGHSFGALSARKLYVVACGETADAPFEPAIQNCKGKAWAAKIDRIILLAGMNRGWRISHHLSLKTALLWTLGVLIGNLVWIPTLDVGAAVQTLLAGGLTLILWMVVTRV